MSPAILIKFVLGTIRPYCTLATWIIKIRCQIVFSKNIVKNVQFPNDGLLPCKIIITDLLHREDDKHIEDIYINIYKYDTLKNSPLCYCLYIVFWPNCPFSFILNLWSWLLWGNQPDWAQSSLYVRVDGSST